MRRFPHAFSSPPSPLDPRRALPVLAVALLLLASLLAAEEPSADASAETTPAAVEPGLPFLWKVEKEGRAKTSFLFGTMHASDKRITRRLGQIDWAIQACDGLYTELDMNLAGQIAIAGRTMLPSGTSLSDVLPEETYLKLRRYLRMKGMPGGAFDRFRPWVALMQLSLLELKDFNPAEVLDAKLFARAAELGREVGGLETMEEQISVFDSLTDKEQAMLLDATLDHMIENPGFASESMEKLVDRYVGGDEEALVEFIEEMEMAELMDTSPELEEIGDRLSRRLLEDRNHRMAERMDAMMASNPGKAFLYGVGLAHYPGEEGVLDLLRQQGYEVTRVTEEEFIMNAGADWDAPPSAEPTEAAPEEFPEGSLADRLLKRSR
jgi:uncharacterized protein YbaP (TraB family)